MGRGQSSTLFLNKEVNIVVENNNATCSICGNAYRKCLSCKDTMRLQPWKDVTDTSECYKVFQVVRGYSIGLYTKEEFKSKLKNIDLSNLENFYLLIFCRKKRQRKKVLFMGMRLKIMNIRS